VSEVEVGSNAHDGDDGEHAHPHVHSPVNSHVHSHGLGGIEPTTSPTIARILWIAVAVCGVLTLGGLVVLWPGGDGGGSDPLGLGADPVAARVESVTDVPCSYDALLLCRLVGFEPEEGPDAGSLVAIEVGLDTRIGEGDGITVLIDELPDGTVVYSFYEFQRTRPMLLLGLAFVTAVVLLGRWRGVGALAGLVVSLLVIVSFALPSILDGNNAFSVAIVTASAIAFVALFLAHGRGIGTAVALLATFASLLLTTALGWAFIAATNLTGYTDDSSLLLAGLASGLDARGIVLAGLVIGSLGVLDDVVVTQVSAVAELRRARPTASVTEIVGPALRIGRDHISSTVNTLFLAYAGASLPLLLLFTEAGEGVGSVITREVVAVEVVRALVGSIGLVASVPIATSLAARVFSGAAEHA
jgi:uncharacterized membrane protein